MFKECGLFESICNHWVWFEVVSADTSIYKYVFAVFVFTAFALIASVVHVHMFIYGVLFGIETYIIDTL